MAATTTQKKLRTCKNGHQYHKSSDCPVCPICEQERKPPEHDFLSVFSAPARRALENNGIKTVQQLSKCSEAQILQLHGMGAASLPRLRDALKKAGLHFKK